MIKMTARIVAEYLAGNPLPAASLPDLIRSVHQALSQVGQEPEDSERPVPAVPVKKSVATGHIICLDCGQSLKMLKRHLANDHNMTPEEYRAKWGLPADYPLVAPSYAARRSELARQYGLGTKRRKDDEPEVVPAVEDSTAPAESEAPKRGYRYPVNRWAKTPG